MYYCIVMRYLIRKIIQFADWFDDKFDWFFKNGNK